MERSGSVYAEGTYSIGFVNDLIVVEVNAYGNAVCTCRISGIRAVRAALAAVRLRRKILNLDEQIQKRAVPQGVELAFGRKPLRILVDYVLDIYYVCRSGSVVSSVPDAVHGDAVCGERSVYLRAGIRIRVIPSVSGNNKAGIVGYTGARQQYAGGDQQ